MKEYKARLLPAAYNDLQEARSWYRDSVIILAIHHTSIDSRKWKKRLQKK